MSTSPQTSLLRLSSTSMVTGEKARRGLVTAGKRSSPTTGGCNILARTSKENLQATGLAQVQSNVDRFAERGGKRARINPPLCTARTEFTPLDSGNYSTTAPTSLTGLSQRRRRRRSQPRLPPPPPPPPAAPRREEVECNRSDPISCARGDVAEGVAPPHLSTLSGRQECDRDGGFFVADQPRGSGSRPVLESRQPSSTQSSREALATATTTSPQPESQMLSKSRRRLCQRLLRTEFVLLVCLILNISSATTVAANGDEGQKEIRELLLPTIAQRHLLTRQQQRSFYSNEVVRLLNKRKNTSAALQYIEETHDKWNHKKESCHRANLTPFGITLHLNRNQAGHVINSKYQIFDRAERVARQTADFLARLFREKSASKHHKSQNGNHEASLYSALTSANLADPSDGKMIVGSGIVIEDKGVNVYAYQQKLTRNIQFNSNFSYDSNESVNKCWWYRELHSRYSDGFTRVKHAQGLWSSPYYDCEYSGHWLVTYAAPIMVSSVSNSSTADTQLGNVGTRRADNESVPEEEMPRKMIGISTVSLNLNHLDMDQCPGDDPFFANTHLCDTSNSKCEFIPDQGFRRGSYRCRCMEGFYLPSNIDADPGINGHALEMDFVENMNLSEPERASVPHLRCLPCPPGCITCEDEAPCFVEYNETLRGSLVIAQLGFCSLILFLMALIYKLRKNQCFASSMWILLEAILLGAFLIYQGIVIRYFEPSALTCIFEPWFREIGFSTLYGAIGLKIYRIVAEFQTRKAHRVCVRSKDLLRYLIGLVSTVALYMTAWTAMVADSTGGSVEDILFNSTNSQGLRFLSCRPLVWDYVTESAEILFLVLSLRLAFRLRNAYAFPEATALTRSIVVELVFSTTLYVLKHLLGDSVQPDYAFVAYFIRCHLTVTLVLMLIFLPKLCSRSSAHYRGGNARGGRAAQNQSGTAVSNESGVDPAQRLHQAIVGNGELDIAEISLADMDLEDIRAELRRAYTQLEIMRNKSMRKENPHISKRRGGRKATHRRFSLQPFHHKHKHQQHSAGSSGATDHKHNHPNLPETTEVSKTPEESTASMEGNFGGDGPSVTSLSAEHRGQGPSLRHHH